MESSPAAAADVWHFYSLSAENLITEPGVSAGIDHEHEHDALLMVYLQLSSISWKGGIFHRQ